jgi:hypothetical protein
MSIRELGKKVHAEYVFLATGAAGAAAATGIYIDRQGYAGVLFICFTDAHTGTTADTVWTVLSSTATSGGATATGAGLVTSNSLTGVGALTQSTATTTQIGWLDYHGTERYVTVSMDPVTATGESACCAIKYGAMKTPAA